MDFGYIFPLVADGVLQDINFLVTFCIGLGQDNDGTT